MEIDGEALRGLHPLLRGLLTAGRERHEDMANLVRGLPDGAFDWRPAPEAPSIAGLVLHIADVEAFIARVAGGSGEVWQGVNGSRMDEQAGEAALIAAIAAVDAAIAGVLSSLSPGRLSEPQPGEERTIGEMLVEDLDHSAMHYGQLQLTRHLWEAAHPQWPSDYVHWR